MWIVLASCGGGLGPVADRPPEVPPLPYTKAALREGLVAGRSFRIRITRGAQPPFDLLFEVKDASKGGVAVLGTRYDLDGKMVVPTREERLSWDDVYADFVKTERATAWTHGPFESALGRRVGWCFDTDEGVGAAALQLRTCFADDVVGPPALATTTRGGREVARAELLEVRTRVPGDPP